MDLNSDHLMSALAGVVGGGGTIGMITKVLVQNWIKNHDKRNDKVGDGMQAMAIEMAKVSVRLEDFAKVAERVGKQGEDVAVLKTQVGTIKENLNGLGAKLRSMNRP
jgi:hypothetical protein